MTGQLWRDIDSWPGYQVSRDGRVRSVDRHIRTRDGQWRFWRGRIRRTFFNPHGGEYTTLSRGGRTKTVYVRTLHRQAFGDDL